MTNTHNAMHHVERTANK